MICAYSSENNFLHYTDLLPKSIDEASHHLRILNEIRKFLYLENDKDIGKSWVILQKINCLLKLMELFLLLTTLDNIVISQIVLV